MVLKFYDESQYYSKTSDHIIDAEGKLAIGSFNFEIFETPTFSVVLLL